jgi:hypothetical protein
LRSAAALLLALAAVPGAAALPSHFGVTVGFALLCHDQISPGYFRDYLKQYFGAPARYEGGAYWYKTKGAQLWGSPVTEVFVSDGASDYAFLGALVKAAPPALAKAIEAQPEYGVWHFTATGSAPFSPLRAPSGAQIVFKGAAESKIYCVNPAFSGPR